MTATHLDFGIVGRTRGTGRTGSAVAAAAYNLCARLDGYDYSRKASEHVGGCMMLPPGSCPDLAEPGALWRSAEGAEKRADAQLARQVLISLPRECPPELRLDLARAIVQPWVDDGMGAQVDIHCPRASDGGEQPHAHVLLTLRRVTDAGLAPTKERTWNQAFRAGEGRAMRKAITDRATAFLLAHGIDAGMDSRSLADRGESRTPEPSARRQDWQRWQRAGSDHEQAPAPVVAVFAHRRRRSALAVATDQADQAAAEAADLAEQLAAVPTVPTRPPQPRTRTIPAREVSRILPAITVSAVPPTAAATDARRAEHVPAAAQEAHMPRPAPRPISYRDRRPAPPRTEPWMRQEGGYDALSDALQAAATRSYDEWARQKPNLARRHDLADYVRYVQDRQARESERERLATEAPGVPVRPRPEGVAPATGGAAHRAAHLSRTLADQAPPLPSSTWRARVYSEEGLARIWPPGIQEHIVDRGDRLEPGGPVTPALAAATIQIASDRGWQSLTLSGSNDYREAMAVAAALHQPPLRTDHALSKAGLDKVASQLRERAMPPALDSAAVQQLAATNPAAAATRVLDHAEARARAGLAGRPEGSTVPADIAAPRVAALIAARDQAREDRKEAAEALAAHHAAFSWGSRLLDPAVRARHAAMKAESRRLTSASLRLDADLPKATRKVSIAAEREARANRAAADDWTWSKPVRQSEASLAQIVTIRQAVEAGSPQAVEALARGDMKSAAAAAKAWQATEAGPLRIASSPAESAQWQRAEAINRTQKWEVASTDPDGLARVRQITAAVLAGHPGATCATAGGDYEGAAEAAANWREEQARKATEEAQERAQLAAVAAARTPQEPAQPAY